MMTLLTDIMVLVSLSESTIVVVLSLATRQPVRRRRRQRRLNSHSTVPTQALLPACSTKLCGSTAVSAAYVHINTTPCIYGQALQRAWSADLTNFDPQSADSHRPRQTNSFTKLQLDC